MLLFRLALCLFLFDCGMSASSETDAICSPPCENGGICISSNVCNCPSGFSGSSCEITTTREKKGIQADRIVIMICLVSVIAITVVGIWYKRRLAAQSRRIIRLEDPFVVSLSRMSKNVKYQSVASRSNKTKGRFVYPTPYPPVHIHSWILSFTIWLFVNMDVQDLIDKKTTTTWFEHARVIPINLAG